jgi:hypothetical protein
VPSAKNDALYAGSGCGKEDRLVGLTDKKQMSKEARKSISRIVRQPGAILDDNGHTYNLIGFR